MGASRGAGFRGAGSAESLGSLVRTASRARSAFQLVVALLLGIGGACVMQGALVLSGGEPRSAGAWIVASLAGFLCALAWRLENPVSEAATARALDRGLHQQGGLLAAWEAHGASSRSTLAQLAEARCLSRIELPAAIRAGMPSIVLPVAAPLVGAAVLALSLEAREASRAAPRLELLDTIAGLARSSQALATELGSDVDPEDAEPAELEALSLAEDLATRARALEEASGRPERGADAHSDTAGELEACERGLFRLSELVGDRPDLRERVAEAQNALDSGRRALDPGGAGAGAAGGPDARDVTGGPVAGTMPGPADRTRPSPRPSAEHERGAFTGTYWPAEYDGIVSEWVERARRRASEPNAPPPER
jgi:hypothetical protein